MMKLLLLPLLLLAALIPARSAELELYCTTDLHGHADRLAALGGALRQGGDAVLRVDVGDTAQGTLLSQFSGGRIMIESLNALNFDCWIPGNTISSWASTGSARWRRVSGASRSAANGAGTASPAFRGNGAAKTAFPRR